MHDDTHDNPPATERYIISGARRLRCGLTTGTCAALAALAATQTLLTGTVPQTVTLITPKGWPACATVLADDAPHRYSVSEPSFCCGIRKDAGDDPDATDGCIVRATVTLFPNDAQETVTVTIDGGAGVGRVTCAGLEQPVGNAAINRVPRAMLTDAVRACCEDHAFCGSVRVVISVDDGEKLAARTFNPHLGITGGISILGTSGVVEPMSEYAIIETIDAALRLRAAEAAEREAAAENALRTAAGAVSAQRRRRPLILTPGNYGADFAAAWPALATFDAPPPVRCANFIGEALDRAVLHGFTHILLIGHAGKLVKLAGGIMNTHSRTADCRMELLCAHAALLGAARATLSAIMQCVTVDAALDVLDATTRADGIDCSATEVMQCITRAAQRHLATRVARTGSTAAVGVVMFTEKRKIIGISDEARALMQNTTHTA